MNSFAELGAAYKITIPLFHQVTLIIAGESTYAPTNTFLRQQQQDPISLILVPPEIVTLIEGEMLT